MKESNGNFQILWKTNHEGYFSEHLTAEVTYHIKGGTVKVGAIIHTLFNTEIICTGDVDLVIGMWLYQFAIKLKYIILVSSSQVTKPVKPTTFKGQNYYEIPGEDLESSTTYAVSVRSYTNRSGKFSDSSEEWEFTTRKCHLLSLYLLLFMLKCTVYFLGMIRFL